MDTQRTSRPRSRLRPPKGAAPAWPVALKTDPRPMPTSIRGHGPLRCIACSPAVNTAMAVLVVAGRATCTGSWPLPMAWKVRLLHRHVGGVGAHKPGLWAACASASIHAADRNCLAAKAQAMRDASGPFPSLKAWLVAPPLQAWARPLTSTSEATVLPLRLKSVTDIG